MWFATLLDKSKVTLSSHDAPRSSIRHPVLFMAMDSHAALWEKNRKKVLEALPLFQENGCFHEICTFTPTSAASTPQEDGLLSTSCLCQKDHRHFMEDLHSLVSLCLEGIWCLVTQSCEGGLLGPHSAKFAAIRSDAPGITLRYGVFCSSAFLFPLGHPPPALSSTKRHGRGHQEKAAPCCPTRAGAAGGAVPCGCPRHQPGGAAGCRSRVRQAGLRRLI